MPLSFLSDLMDFLASAAIRIGLWWLSRAHDGSTGPLA